MKLFKFKFIFFLFGILSISSCGKEYNCKCTSVISTKSGSAISTQTNETVSSDRYNKKETARLMCENLKTLSSTATTTSQSTCILE